MQAPTTPRAPIATMSDGDDAGVVWTGVEIVVDIVVGRFEYVGAIDTGTVGSPVGVEIPVPTV